ncbi:hypothetical protein [Paenibacillus contaminans]
MNMYHNEVFEYDPTTDTWTPATTSRRPK